MNRRQRKKRNCPWIQLKKYKPGDVALLTFDMNDENCHMDVLGKFINNIIESKVLPDGVGIAALPNWITIDAGNKEYLQEMINRAQEVCDKL